MMAGRCISLRLNARPVFCSSEVTEMEQLTCEAVLEAIEKFDGLGPDGFFLQYRVTRARTWFISHEGQEYDLKAIVRVALDLTEPGDPLDEPRVVAGWLNDLGFETVRHQGAVLHEVTDAIREGHRRWAIQNRAERNPRLAREAKERNAANNPNIGWVKCEACGFKDKKHSMFDAHHPKPLEVGERRTRVEHLAVLCPTCHRWAHAKAKARLHPLPVEEVRRGRGPLGRSNRR